MYFILFKYRTRSNELCMTCKYYLVGNINVIQCRDCNCFEDECK